MAGRPNLKPSGMGEGDRAAEAWRSAQSQARAHKDEADDQRGEDRQGGCAAGLALQSSMTRAYMRQRNLAGPVITRPGRPSRPAFR